MDFHLGELVPALALRLAVVALFGLSVMDLLLFEIVFQTFNLFEHSNIGLAPRFERIWHSVFVGPAMHRRHHSVDPRHLNSNYGTIFSVWDRWLGTDKGLAFEPAMRFGLTGHGDLPLAMMIRLPFS